MNSGAGARVAVLLTAAFATACVSTPEAPPATPPPVGLAEILDRPAERALHEALRAYDDGHYSSAETSLRLALAAHLQSPRDQALAHKLLAFITCTSDRAGECEAAFRAARAADPGFALSRAESGHPAWGPVYRRTLTP